MWNAMTTHQSERLATIVLRSAAHGQTASSLPATLCKWLKSVKRCGTLRLRCIRIASHSHRCTSTWHDFFSSACAEFCYRNVPRSETASVQVERVRCTHSHFGRLIHRMLDACYGGVEAHKLNCVVMSRMCGYCDAIFRTNGYWK